MALILRNHLYIENNMRWFKTNKDKEKDINYIPIDKVDKATYFLAKIHAIDSITESISKGVRGATLERGYGFDFKEILSDVAAKRIAEKVKFEIIAEYAKEKERILQKIHKL